MNEEYTNKFIIDQINKRKNQIVIQTQEQQKEISNNYTIEQQNLNDLYTKFNNNNNEILKLEKELDSLEKGRYELNKININEIKKENNLKIKKNDELIKKLYQEIKINEESIKENIILKNNFQNDLEDKKNNLNLILHSEIDKNQDLIDSKKIFFKLKKDKILDENEKLNQNKKNLILNLEQKENIYLNEKDERQKNRKDNINTIINLKKNLKNIQSDISKCEYEVKNKEILKDKFIKKYKEDKEVKYSEVNQKVKNLKNINENNLNLEILQEIDILNNSLDNFEENYNKELKVLNYEINKLYKNIKLLNYKKKIQKNNIQNSNINISNIDKNTLISKEDINKLKKEISIIEEKIIMNNIEFNNIESIENNIFEKIQKENMIKKDKILQNNIFIEEELSNNNSNLDIPNLQEKNTILNSEIIYLNNINNSIKQNNEIHIENILESKRSHEDSINKIKLKLDISKNNSFRIKHKINLKENINSKYFKEFENNSNELFINQLLDLYNLKKLNEML